MTILLGIGQLTHFSYWLKVITDQKNVIWEGHVYAKEVIRDKSKTLEVEFPPIELRQLWASGQLYYNEWEKIWEEIPVRLLTDGNNVNDGEADRQSNSVSANL